MMNTPNQTSHTEIEYPTSNAMEQAALLKARCAVARWRCCDHLHLGADAGSRSEREQWYAALEARMYEWIGSGGLAVEAGDWRTEPHSENSYAG